MRDAAGILGWGWAYGAMHNVDQHGSSEGRCPWRAGLLR